MPVYFFITHRSYPVGVPAKIGFVSSYTTNPMKRAPSYAEYQSKLKSIRTPEEAAAFAQELLAPMLAGLAEKNRNGRSKESRRPLASRLKIPDLGVDTSARSTSPSTSTNGVRSSGKPPHDLGRQDQDCQGDHQAGVRYQAHPIYWRR